MSVKLKYQIVPLLLALLFYACRNNEPLSDLENEVREPASLVVTADLPVFVESRASFVEEKKINHISLFLIDYLENKLVAYRNIYPDVNSLLHSYDDSDMENGFINETTGLVDPSLTSGTRVRVTFNYDNPKHGLAEKLSRGAYILLAAANFENSDLVGQLEIYQRIKEIIDQFNKTPNTGIGNFRQEYETFYNQMLQIPEKEDSNGTKYDPYLRPSNIPIPLSCTLGLNLISGTNVAAAELQHTCARVRIDVCNYSNLPLTIRDLSMSDNFTQSACYLFPRANRLENYEIASENAGKGAPITTDNNAIKAFSPNTKLTKEQGTQTIFDGLIYESIDEQNNYTYTIELGYDVSDIVTYNLKNNGSPIRTTADISSQGPYFLIKCCDADSFLYTANDKVYATSESLTPQQLLDRCAASNYYYDCVWELVPSGSYYYLRNVQTEDYIAKIKSHDKTTEDYRLEMTELPNADTFETTTPSEGCFLFKSSTYYYWSWGYYYAYINIRENNSSLPVVGWYENGPWSQFELYPLSAVNGLNSRREIVLRTIDKQSSVVSDVHEIQRNDFIRILIEVSYNPDKGDFEFIVNDWESGGGEINFN